jgi:hypothetical protein
MLSTIIHKIQTVLHRQEMQHNLGWLKEVLIKSTSPSPLMGEGWGEGEKLSTYPSPQPSPSGGEGVNQHISK